MLKDGNVLLETRKKNVIKLVVKTPTPHLVATGLQNAALFSRSNVVSHVRVHSQPVWVLLGGLPAHCHSLYGLRETLARIKCEPVRWLAASRIVAVMQASPEPRRPAPTRKTTVVSLDEGIWSDAASECSEDDDQPTVVVVQESDYSSDFFCTKKN